MSIDRVVLPQVARVGEDKSDAEAPIFGQDTARPPPAQNRQSARFHTKSSAMSPKSAEPVTPKE